MTVPTSKYNHETLTFMGCKRALYIAALFTTFDLFNSFSYSFDTINQAQFLSDSANESLVSSDGNFRLGFFSPGNSRFRYVGIWFNKVSVQTVVWVANRESPIKSSEGIFKVGEDGNLGIFDGNESSPLWSTNVSIPKKPSRAKLLDSGNLVLVTEHGESDTGTILWQSFDYPTDTLLPGMKFGFNRKTGITHVAISWKSSDDPAPGEFSGKYDHRGSPQFFLSKSSVPYYRCGPWNGRRLNGLPDAITKHQMSQKVQYSNQIDLMNYTFVNDENIDVYSGFPSIVGTFTRIVLEPLGTLQRQFWHENRTWMKFWVGSQDFCDGYGRCGVNAICNLDTMVFCLCLPGFEPLHPQDWNLNCVETRKVDGCGKGVGEGFVRLEGVKWPDARNSTVYGNMNLKECERECLKSCNCTGYASSNVDESEQGCIIWYGGLKDMRQYKDEQHFYLRVDAVELAASARKNSKQFLAENSTLAFIVMPISVEVLVIATFCYCWKRRAKSKDRKEKQSRRGSSLFDSATSLSNHEDFPYSKSSSEGGNPELTLFKLSTLMAATDNFSSANKLGRGGFGPVYKGQIPNRQEIAVKRLSKNSGQGIKEFKNEVLLIAKLQHRNLVRLLGYCIDEDEKMLIYEFMPNKSLDYFIFDQSRKYLLDWRKRFDIILGIARGILYLHEDSRLRIVHRDLKASNILLDAEMKPRISDFGTARIFGGDQSQANTSKIVGTFGYMSPEYVLHGIFSTKSDVFSFGVLLLEIISGKMNGSFFPDDPFSNLIKYAWELWRDGKALQIIDSSIADSCPAPEVLRCIQVGLLCVQDYAGERPAMSTVVLMLSNETTLPSPNQSTFVIKRPQDKLDPYVAGNMASINEVTITTYTAR